MKLNEKIYYCRKKAGLSQEALAEKLGVSRQAVSKWETGDAVPEIGKLALLASTFGVTADWLISEDEPIPETTKEPMLDRGFSKIDCWADRIAEFASKILKKYAWLCGVALALIGVYRVISIAIPLFSVSAHAPSEFMLLSLFYVMIGIAMIIGGVALTVVLRKWRKKQQ